MPSQCKYAQLVIQMYLKGLSSRELAAQANMNYQTLRRKMRGDSPVTLEDLASYQPLLYPSRTMSLQGKTIHVAGETSAGQRLFDALDHFDRNRRAPADW